VVAESEIHSAGAVLTRGGLVAFPTETVYGLGADASSPDAVRRLYAVKGRPHDHPVIVHIAGAGELAHWAREIPDTALVFARHFWPGPLTLILKRQPHVTDLVTGGQDTIGLRVPGHRIALALLAAFGGGIAAPSANRFGHLSATTADAVRQELGSDVDLVLDGGPCAVGIESTIVDLTGATPAVLRPGGVPVAALDAALGSAVAVGRADAPRASGTLPAHYAPRTPLMLMAGDLMLELAASLARQGKKIAVLAREARAPLGAPYVWIAAPVEPAAYAHGLYASLRRLDESGSDVILVEQLPVAPEWLAVKDRLTRAAASTDER
jgi:L-threonylcarbamoyladenylate synthase